MRDILCRVALDNQQVGFQAFLEYDTVILQYRGDLSAYTMDPFSLHIQPIATAEVSPGEINVDGSVGFFEPGTDEEALLVVLTFEVVRECVETAVEFRIGPPDSKLSFEGETVPTMPVDSRDFYLDDTPPMIECPADITVDSLDDVPPPDTDTVTATDNCTDVTVTHLGDVDDGEPGCPLEPRTIIRTYRADDECGTGASCTQTITVGDGDLGLEDFVDFAACWSGPGVPADPGCECSDYDGDGDVDLEDGQQFQILFDGA